MSYNVNYTHNFSKEFKQLSKKYPSLGDDVLTLIESLELYPLQGDEVFKNCYKIRLAIKSKGRGKSGGARVITFVQIVHEEVFLISIFDKSDRSTITDAELKQLIKKQFG